MNRLLLLTQLLFACPSAKPPPVEASTRCEIDLGQYNLSAVGTGVSTNGSLAGVVLQNSRLSALITTPGRSYDSLPQGGTLIIDGLLEVGPNYALGRTVKVDQLEVLNDGASGGYAVVAASGDDTVNDAINVKRVLGDSLAINPEAAVPSVRVTTYYVLSPGENRVRMLTAVCNRGQDHVVMPVGDLLRFSNSDVVNAGGCNGGLGVNGCTTDTSQWLGAQGDGRAVAYRAFNLTDFTVAATNGRFTVGDSQAVLIGVEDAAGVENWATPGDQQLGGFGVLPGDKNVYVRDVHVGGDLAEITSTFLAMDQATKSRATITTKYADGTPAAGTRVSIRRVTGDTYTLGLSGTDGVARFDLPPGNYLLSGGQQGYGVEPHSQLTVPSNGSVDATVTLGESHFLTVNNTGPATSRVVVRCQGECANYDHLFTPSTLPAGVAAVRRIGNSTQLRLPPGEYDVEVTGGGDFTRHRETVNLTSGDQTVDATLVQAVDTTGWALLDEGDQVVTFDYGSFSAWPPQGTLFDWTGADGPTLRLDELFELMTPGDEAIILDTPRTTLSALKVDTASGATHASSSDFRFDGIDNPFSFNFHAQRVTNIAEMNDWLTFLRIGQRKTAVGPVTWLQEDGLRNNRAIASNGPFVSLTATVAGGDGTVFVPGDTIHASNGAVIEVTVTVQGADWVQYDEVELLISEPGRGSVEGAPNNTHISSGAEFLHTHDPAALPLDGQRVHTTDTFTVTATQDSFLVALVRGTSASAAVDSVTGERAFAVSSAIYIDVP